MLGIFKYECLRACSVSSSHLALAVKNVESDGLPLVSRPTPAPRMMICKHPNSFLFPEDAAVPDLCVHDGPFRYS